MVECNLHEGTTGTARDHIILSADGEGPYFFTQSSRRKSSICLNSLILWVTSIPLFAITIEAIIRSLGPTIVPFFSSLARIEAYFIAHSL
jgi:hypothetical protein